MNFCGKCGTEREKDDHFCSQCGYAFDAEVINNEYLKKRKFSFTPNKQDIQTHQNHLTYHKSIGKIQGYFSFLLLILIILCSQAISHLIIESKMTLMPTVLGFIAGIFIFIVLSSFNASRRLAHTFYQPSYPYTGYSIQYVYDTLDSAKLNSGDHRCIYCGNNRLYRKGIYASDQCTVNCTKCKTFLYYD